MKFLPHLSAEKCKCGVYAARKFRFVSTDRTPRRKLRRGVVLLILTYILFYKSAFFKQKLNIRSLYLFNCNFQQFLFRKGEGSLA